MYIYVSYIMSWYSSMGVKYPVFFCVLALINIFYVQQGVPGLVVNLQTKEKYLLTSDDNSVVAQGNTEYVILCCCLDFLALICTKCL